MKKTLALIFSLSIFAACAEKAGVSGHLGERIKGKNLSVQAFYLDPNKSPQEMPSINVTNESDKNFTIAPMTITAWFKQAGKKEKIMNAAAMLGNDPLTPHKTVLLTAGFLKFDVAPSDQLDKLTLSLGDGGNQEVFTINL